MRWSVVSAPCGRLSPTGAHVRRSAVRHALATAALLVSGVLPGIGGAATVSMPESLSCSASMPARLRPGQAAMLTLTLRNGGRQTAYLLRRNTPFEGWLADSVTVERDEKPVSYIGAMAKRMPPSLSEYLLLPAGKTYRFRAPLQGGYDVTAAGSYRVQWRGDVLDVVFGARPQSGRELSPATLNCNPVTFIRAR